MKIQTVQDMISGEKKVRSMILVRDLLMIGISLLCLLSACTPASSASPTQTSAPFGSPAARGTVTPLPFANPTSVPSTFIPSPVAAQPLSAVAMQALTDAFNCLTNNLTYAPYINLTHYCPGYWDITSANITSLDGFTIREQLEADLNPMTDIRWKFDSLTEVQKDERLSTPLNSIYTGMLSTTLTANVTLSCPSGTPAPFQTMVTIPIQGVARIAVYDYLGQAQETIQIESWTIQGNPLQVYCATLH